MGLGLGGWWWCVRGWANEDLEIVPPCVVCRAYARAVRWACVVCACVCVSVLCVLWAV